MQYTEITLRRQCDVQANNRTKLYTLASWR